MLVHRIKKLEGDVSKEKKEHGVEQWCNPKTHKHFRELHNVQFKAIKMPGDEDAAAGDKHGTYHQLTKRYCGGAHAQNP